MSSFTDPVTIEKDVSQMWNELQQNIKTHQSWLLEKERNFQDRVISNEIKPTLNLLKNLKSAIVKIKNSKKLLDSWSSMVQSISYDIRCNTFELKNVRRDIRDNAREPLPVPVYSFFFEPSREDTVKIAKANMAKQKRSVRLLKKQGKIESIIRKNLEKFKFEIDSFNRGIVSIKQKKHRKKLNLNDVLKIVDDLSENGSPLDRATIEIL